MDLPRLGTKAARNVTTKTLQSPSKAWFAYAADLPGTTLRHMWTLICSRNGPLACLRSWAEFNRRLSAMKIIYVNNTCGDLQRYVWRKTSIFPTIPDFQDSGGKSRSRGLLSFRYKVFSVQVDSIQIEVVSRHYRRRFVILHVENWFDSTHLYARGRGARALPRNFQIWIKFR